MSCEQAHMAYTSVSWLSGFDEVSYSSDQEAYLARLEEDLAKQLAAKPSRLQHSYSVALCAEKLALLYGVDPFKSRVAGILHDWDKAYSNDELIERARKANLDLGVDLSLVQPLLHGILAAHELPQKYPELPEDVLHAIKVHTIGSAHPTPLDMIVFIADGIEVFRPVAEGIEAVRNLVGTVSLPELYWRSFANGVAYVIATERWLYPGTIDIYNQLVLARERGEEPFTTTKETA